MTKSEKIAQINAKLTADIAAVKAQKEQADADYYAKVAELQRAACEAKNMATDDVPQEVENYDIAGTAISFDGTLKSAIRTAVAVLKDSPDIPVGCSLDVSLFHHNLKALGIGDEISLHLTAFNGNQPEGKRSFSVEISEHDNPDEQIKRYTDWRTAVDHHFAAGKEEDDE